MTANSPIIMKQDQMTTLIKIKQIQRQCIISLQSGVHSKLVLPYLWRYINILITNYHFEKSDRLTK